MSQPRILQREVPLISAEARFRVTAQPQGQRAQIVFEIAPAAFTGNTPGVEYRFYIHWRDASNFAGALMEVRRRMVDMGEGLVPGKNYGRHRFLLPGHADICLFLTADECVTLAHNIEEAVEFGTRRQPLDIVKSLPRLK
jgi:hypothetical protein